MPGRFQGSPRLAVAVFDYLEMPTAVGRLRGQVNGSVSGGRPFDVWQMSKRPQQFNKLSGDRSTLALRFPGTGEVLERGKNLTGFGQFETVGSSKTYFCHNLRVYFPQPGQIIPHFARCLWLAAAQIKRLGQEIAALHQRQNCDRAFRLVVRSTLAVYNPYFWNFKVTSRQKPSMH